MHRKRLLTALLLIPPLILLIMMGNPALFAFMVAVVAVLSLWEYLRIVYHGHTLRARSLVDGWIYLGAVLMVAGVHFQLLSALLSILVLSLIGAAVISMPRFRAGQDAPSVAMKAIFGLFYIPLLLSFLILLRNAADGQLWVVFLLWVIAWGDSGAFYIGTWLGRHKLCPSVSPKKTVEGALGGLGANLLFGWLFKILFFNSLSTPACLTFALVVGVVGQAGDLFESGFKRTAGIKDSSNMLPGHGGVLDRLDSLLFAAPVGYLLKEYLLP